MKKCNINVTDFTSFGLNAICNLALVSELELKNESKQKLIDFDPTRPINDDVTLFLFRELLLGAKCGYYENHWTKPEEKVGLVTRTILTCLFTLLLILSLISNVTCAKVAYHFLKIEKTTSYTLLSLAVSDVLHTLVLYPLEMNNLMFNMFWELGEISCKVLPFLISTTNLASSLTLCCIAVGRCVAVVRACKIGPQPPNKYSGISALAIMISWVISASLNIVYLLTFNLKEEYADPRTELCGEDGVKKYKYEKVKVCFFDSAVFKSDYLTKYYIYILPSIVFIPLCIVVTTGYFYLSFFLWSSNAARTPSQLDKKQHKYKKIIRVLMGLVALFFVCRFPAVVYNWMVGMSEYQVNHKMVSFRYFLVLLRFSNCVLNPFFYGMIHDHFRKTVEKFFNYLKIRAYCVGGSKETSGMNVVQFETTESLYSSMFKGNIFFATGRNYTPPMNSRY